MEQCAPKNGTGLNRVRIRQPFHLKNYPNEESNFVIRVSAKRSFLSIELRWLVEFTLKEEAIRERKEGLKLTLEQKDEKNKFDEQSPVDGSYGGCYSEWFIRVWQTAERISDIQASNKIAQYPFQFLDRINSQILKLELKDPHLKNACDHVLEIQARTHLKMIG